MEKRNFLSKLFRPSKPNKEMDKIIDAKFEELTYFKSYFHTMDLYSNDIARSSAKRIATDIAQVVVKHQLKKKPNDYDIIEHSNISKLFRIRPNAFQTPFQFFYQITLALILDGVSYSYIERDERGNPVALIPIEEGSYESFKVGDEYYLKFSDLKGQELLVSMDSLVCLRRDQRYMIKNENPFKLIKHIVDLIDTNYSAMKSAMENGGKINAILKFSGMMNEDQMKKAVDRFGKLYLKVDGYKVAGLDSTIDFTQIDPAKWETLDTEQMDFLKEKIYNYIGINQSVVEGKATESEILSHIALNIEPIVLDMNQEFTYKLFTKKELEVGNRLFFDTRLLKFSTLTARTAYYDKMISHGVLSINEVRAMENLSPIENGDIYRVTLNSVTLDNANEYQLGKGGDEDGEGTEKEVDE